LDYVYKNFLYKNLDNKGILYKDGKILFMGNSWSGILQYLRETDNAPEVREMFRAQLEQREVIKLRAEAKKPKDPEPPVQEEPKKKPIMRRPRIDRRLV
tara:strand:+ start:142 stop:438 length:297 start_codon:yes stop_codon:yes gene_type:complete